MVVNERLVSTSDRAGTDFWVGGAPSGVITIELFWVRSEGNCTRRELRILVRQLKSASYLRHAGNRSSVALPYCKWFLLIVRVGCLWITIFTGKVGLVEYNFNGSARA